MSKNSLGIYIHVPFCRSKCPYCDFYSITDKSFVKDYISAVCRELELWSGKIDKSVDTIYFGGGTPSVLLADDIVRILNVIRNNFRLSNPEITIEINPADAKFLDFEKLKFFGLNRVSIGAQSISGSQLKILGRRHGVDDIKKSIDLVKVCGVTNISLDIILGVPEQKNKDIEDFADFCIDNDIPHVSAYILKIERGTPYYFNKKGLKFWDDDELADFYDYACKMLRNAGYHHYEISNFAKCGFESKHNLKYWGFDDYLGIGPSAHSFVDGQRFYYTKNLKEFIDNARIEYEKTDLEKEFIMLALRTKWGVERDKFKEKFGYDLPKKYFERAKKFEKYGFTKCLDCAIRINESGFLISNAIISEII